MNCFETRLRNSHVKKTFKDDLREQGEDWFESSKVEQFDRRITTMQLQILKADIDILYSRFQETIKSRQMPL